MLIPEFSPTNYFVDENKANTKTKTPERNVKTKLRFLTNITEVIIAKKSWIGFANNGARSKELKLPKIRPGVLPPILISEKDMLDSSTIQRLNLFYAKEFSIWMDIKFIWHNVKHLDYKS